MLPILVEDRPTQTVYLNEIVRDSSYDPTVYANICNGLPWPHSAPHIYTPRNLRKEQRRSRKNAAYQARRAAR